MKWVGQETLIAGCADHQLKVFDLDKLAIQETIFTNHKVVTALDSTVNQGTPVVLCGHEDGVVKLFDLRSSSKSFKTGAQKSFNCHDRLVTQVKIN